MCIVHSTLFGILRHHTQTVRLPKNLPFIVIFFERFVFNYTVPNNKSSRMNKKKIINDPVYGFINIPTALLYDLIEHPIFQRLRRIKQLGLADLVYPGSRHTRFSHAIGAMHLMSVTLIQLKNKGHKISDAEYEAALAAILLHDIGHGPFSHSLECCLLKDARHEEISLLVMEYLDNKFGGKLKKAIEIFSGKYKRKFFNQLVSGQLDVDRMDYLQRDCFFTGVVEGKIALDRIVRMLDVEGDRIVVEEKGIYSIEHFLTSRRLMYWQVYLHKTTVGAEQMLTQIIRRARVLSVSGKPLPGVTPALRVFLEEAVSPEIFRKEERYLEAFTQIDDFDIWASLKFWTNNPDVVLSALSRCLLSRNLFRTELSAQPFPDEKIEQIKEKIVQKMGISSELANYFCCTGEVSNEAYVSGKKKILIKTKAGKLRNVAEASDLPNIKGLGKVVKKFYLCYPKDVL